jgi:glycosyltransferase involved in cell wall biosynthesis
VSILRPLRVVVIGPLRFPIHPPHAGGLEAAVWAETVALRRRGHHVTLIGVRGSDFVERGSVFELPPLEWPDDGDRTDDAYPESHERLSVPALDHALNAIMSNAGRYDVVSNHCLHPLPIRRAPTLGVPMVTTLHTPPDEAFVAAHTDAGGAGSVFVSVSEHTRRVWARVGVPSAVLANGVDPTQWPEGPGGERLVWFGRVVPEKAPHLAVQVARILRRPLVLAGRIGDQRYADDVLFPLLGDGVKYVGVLPPVDLAGLVGGSAAAIATPAWEEPFGLIAPEALITGTPFVGFAIGGVPEIAARSVGMELVAPGDVAEMAVRVDRLIARSASDPSFRRTIRAHAVRQFSIDARISALEERFASLIEEAPIEERSA